MSGPSPKPTGASVGRKPRSRLATLRYSQIRNRRGEHVVRNPSGIDWRHNHAFETLLITVLFIEVVHICRLWEGADPVGFSIPTLAGLIDEVSVFALAERENAEALSVPPQGQTTAGSNEYSNASRGDQKSSR